MNETAKAWIEGLNYGANLYKKLYYHMLGVNRLKLETKLWISNTRDWRIYNRFFQIGLYSGIKWFFGDKCKITIIRIFSDKRSHEIVDSFHTQPIADIQTKSFLKNENIEFDNDRIIEVESDHEKELIYKKESHIVQLVDIITCGLSQVLDYTSKVEGKKIIAETLVRMGLPEKVMVPNKNSRFYKIYSVSFFPKDKISLKKFNNYNLNTIVRKNDQFFIYRTMKYANRDQGNLFE